MVAKQSWGPSTPNESENESEIFLWCLKFFLWTISLVRWFFGFRSVWLTLTFFLAARQQHARGLEPYQIFYVCKYGDRNGSAAMLAAKRPAGVAPELNLRNPLHAGDEAHSERIYPGQGRRYQNPNKGISGPTKKDLCPPNFFLQCIH